ncbi:hypothetical protein HPP92_025049 [Vanilla planifolia]|uniref:Uncharacterized protein n=1 Tax=Vanilla planifolia TaxID=51239 RepID=A0A835UA87_VANPL|nr:hypothetical protein HPP92_025049 [Vanilla planifolia]
MMLVNTFYELEPKSTARAIGPTVPSAYLDDRIPHDNTYALNLFPSSPSACKAWISAVPVGSGVYASFGSLAELSAEQITELAHGLWPPTAHSSGWSATQMGKLPRILRRRGGPAGIVVRWASQMEVLSSGAVGCFVTHCGWNSTTMEGWLWECHGGDAAGDGSADGRKVSGGCVGR